MTTLIEVDEVNGTWEVITNKEKGTIIYALEEYAKILEAEYSYKAKNYVLELIWKIDGIIKGEGDE